MSFTITDQHSFNPDHSTSCKLPISQVFQRWSSMYELK